MGVQYHSFLTLEVSNVTPRPLYPRKEPPVPIRSLRRSGRFVAEREGRVDCGLVSTFSIVLAKRGSQQHHKRPEQNYGKGRKT